MSHRIYLGEAVLVAHRVFSQSQYCQAKNMWVWTTHLCMDMYMKVERKHSVLALYDWRRKSVPNTLDLERFNLSKIIRNPPTVTNDVHHSVFVWWINQAINEFTMTLLAKTTFVVLIGCKGSDSLHMIPLLWEKQERSKPLSGGGWIISEVRPKHSWLHKSSWSHYYNTD